MHPDIPTQEVQILANREIPGPKLPDTAPSDGTVVLVPDWMTREEFMDHLVGLLPEFQDVDMPRALNDVQFRARYPFCKKVGVFRRIHPVQTPVDHKRRRTDRGREVPSIMLLAGLVVHPARILGDLREFHHLPDNL